MVVINVVGQTSSAMNIKNFPAHTPAVLIGKYLLAPLHRQVMLVVRDTAFTPNMQAIRCAAVLGEHSFW
jgi:hypothetical protein